MSTSTIACYLFRIPESTSFSLNIFSSNSLVLFSCGLQSKSSYWLRASSFLPHIATGTLAVQLAGYLQLGWGLLGASLVLSLSWWIAQFVYIMAKPKRTWTGFTWQAFSGLWDFIKLSDASAVMLCLETRYYQIIVLVAGQLKNAEVALDSLSIS